MKQPYKQLLIKFVLIKVILLTAIITLLFCSSCKQNTSTKTSEYHLNLVDQNTIELITVDSVSFIHPDKLIQTLETDNL